MKNILLLCLFLSCNLFFGQEFTVTPEGLRNKENIQKSYLVLDLKEKKASELFQRSIQYINEKYKNPESVIKGKTENEYLRFETFVTDLLIYNNSGAKINIEAKYYTELRFKEGKIKFEILSLDMKAKNYKYKLLFSGSIFKGYVVYKKSGKLFKEQTKIDIENHFNNHVANYLNFLKNKTEENW